jgi:hypothetical protein
MKTIAPTASTIRIRAHKIAVTSWCCARVVTAGCHPYRAPSSARTSSRLIRIAAKPAACKRSTQALAHVVFPDPGRPWSHTIPGSRGQSPAISHSNSQSCDPDPTPEPIPEPTPDRTPDTAPDAAPGPGGNPNAAPGQGIAGIPGRPGRGWSPPPGAARDAVRAGRRTDPAATWVTGL